MLNKIMWSKVYLRFYYNCDKINDTIKTGGLKVLKMLILCFFITFSFASQDQLLQEIKNLIEQNGKKIEQNGKKIEQNSTDIKIM